MNIVYALIGIPASLAVARALFLFCTDPGDRIRVRVEMAGRRVAAIVLPALAVGCSGIVGAPAGGSAAGGAIGCEYCPDGGACAPCDGGAP